MPDTTPHRKLVRDRVPDLIRTRGEVAQTRVLEPEHYAVALLDKLVEESVELRTAEPGQRIDELADVWEVFTTLAGVLGFTLDDVEQAASFKRIVRGGFDGRVWLESTTTPSLSASAPMATPAAVTTPPSADTTTGTTSSTIPPSTIPSSTATSTPAPTAA